MNYGNTFSAAIGLAFGALPPEVNSGRMYLGPGSVPLTTAAAAWDALSAELSAAAIGYTSIIAELTGTAWQGPTSLAMAAAAAPFATWLNETAGSASVVAGQARAAAAAYELAFSTTVPPRAIAANRSLLLALVVTNFLGQNTAAIAATETDYAQMWAQDAAAMYAYAESSALAATLPSFSDPPRTTNPAASAAQSTTAAQQLQTTLSSPLTQILEHIPNVTNVALASASAGTSERGIYVVNMRLAAQETAPWSPRLAVISAPGGYSPPPVSAAWGRAEFVGKLSAPPPWFITAPELRPASSAPTASVVVAPEAASAESVGCGSVLSQSLLGTLSREDPQHARTKSKPIIVRSPAAG